MSKILRHNEKFSYFLVFLMNSVGEEGRNLTKTVLLTHDEELIVYFSRRTSSVKKELQGPLKNKT